VYLSISRGGDRVKCRGQAIREGGQVPNPDSRGVEDGVGDGGDDSDDADLADSLAADRTDLQSVSSRKNASMSGMSAWAGTR
jgi:hypothetical protein